MLFKNYVKDINSRTIINSNGFLAVEVEFVTEYGIIRSSAPSGTSTGSKEAISVDDGDITRSVDGRIKKLREMKGKIMELAVVDIFEFDKKITALDATKNKSNFGSNLMLPISVNFCKLNGMVSKKYLWQYISEITKCEPKMPVPYFNVLNGGRHAGNIMKWQEIMIGFNGRSIAESAKTACLFYQTLKNEVVGRYGSMFRSVGDEGGFAPPIEILEEGIELIVQTSKKCNIEDFSIGIDCAANEFYEDGYYNIRDGKLTGIELGEYYLELIKKYEMISIIEDPFNENDFAAWRYFYTRIPEYLHIVSDDLTATNSEIIEKTGEMYNSVLIKPNQIGTVSETIEAVKKSYENGYEIMCSHRSGETEDTFICSFAVGTGAKFIKCGAPCRGERVSKYNELIRIEEEMKFI